MNKQVVCDFINDLACNILKIGTVLALMLGMVAVCVGGLIGTIWLFDHHYYFCGGLVLFGALAIVATFKTLEDWRLL